MRTGIIAKKIGMSRIFQTDGKNIPVTLLKVEQCKVIDHREIEKDGYSALKISYGFSRKNRMNKPTIGYFKKNKNQATKFTKEFRVSQEGLIDIGQDISVSHFVNGQYVDISGLTIGKGFAGGMKRHNFAGNRATHGVSISHRSHGSTGQCQDPGKVFKGKKMAGRLGNVKKTMQNLLVIETNNEDGLIIVKGSVPGPSGVYVSIRDSVKNKARNLPYPTISKNNVKDHQTNVVAENDKAVNAETSSVNELKNSELKPTDGSKK